MRFILHSDSVVPPKTREEAQKRDRREWDAMPWWKKLLVAAILGGEGASGR